MLTELNIIVSSCHLPTLSQASFSSWKSHSPLPEVLRIWACKLILIVESGWCCRVSTPSCFLFLRFGPALTDLPLEELQHLKGKNGLYCSDGALVERKQGSFFEENNKGVIMDCNINSINNLVIETCVCYF